MELVTVWDVLNSIESQIQVSGQECAESLRLHEEVPEPADPHMPSPMRGMSMGELRQDVIGSLGDAFASAAKRSWAAAQLEYVIHHAARPGPTLFDKRQTGLPRVSDSARADLQRVLFGAANFQQRLIDALSRGKLRNYPRHGAGGLGVSVLDWTSTSMDYDVVHKINFDPLEILPLLIEAGVDLGLAPPNITQELLDTAKRRAAEHSIQRDQRSEAGPVDMSPAPLIPWYRDRPEGFQWQGTKHERALVEFKEERLPNGKTRSFSKVAEEFGIEKSHAHFIYRRAKEGPADVKTKKPEPVSNAFEWRGKNG